MVDPQLRQVFDQAPAVFAITRGPHHVLEFANRAFFQVVGSRPMLGLPLGQAIPELQGQGYLELLDGVYATGRPVTATESGMLVERVAGQLEEAFFNFTYQPWRDARGEVEGVVVIATEVSSLVRARLQAQDSLTLLDAFVASAPVGFAVLDAKLQIRRLNRFLAATAGVSPGEQVGRPFAEVLPSLARSLEPLAERILVLGETVASQHVRGELAATPGLGHHWLASYFPVPGDVQGTGGSASWRPTSASRSNSSGC